MGSANYRKIISFTFFIITACSSNSLYAQLTMGNTGLLHMPSADMQDDGTAMLGGNFLNQHNMPASWTYNTYNYFINITFFPWIEIAYTCHLMSFGEWGKNHTHYNNQDRSFSGRIRVIKEGKFWKHMPAVVIGTYDPASGHYGGGDIILDQGAESHNYFARYYIAISKHFSSKTEGSLGCHLAYIYSRGTGNRFRGIATGVNFQPEFHKNLNLIAEYDAQTFNCGFQYDLLKYFVCTFELQKLKYISAGITLRMHLKKNKKSNE